MNSETNETLIFNASHIISVELKPEIASNCKLRSNFVHEKLLETKNNLSGNPLLLKLSNKGLKFFNPDSQVLIMSHSIHRISYTACDRSSCQFAMVARSTEIGNSQLCYIVRLNSVEEADTINRYIGSLFKDLNHKRKIRKSESVSKNIETSNKSVTEEYLPESKDSPVKSRCVNSIYDDLDTRLKRISTPQIDELVSEKHYVRRLSLCMPSPNNEEQNQGLQNLHSSLEKKPNNANCIIQTIDINRPLLRKKSDHKSNKISAVIERLSFRASRDLSTDLLKSGSPVVALKEQLELNDRLNDKNIFSPDNSRNSFPASISNQLHSQPPKQRFPVLNPSDSTNYLKASALSRKNSAPIPLEKCINNFMNTSEEQPPVPPVRINSLRNPIQHRPNTLIDESPLVRCKGEVSSHFVSGQLHDQDDHLSSITTPSSCGDNYGNTCPDEIKFPSVDILNNQTGKPITQPAANKMNFSASFNGSQQRSFNQNFSNDNRNCGIPYSYFKNLSKDETNDYLLNKELGTFILRNSASHLGCIALSVKVSDISVSHYIIQSSPDGFQIKGLDKIWPSLHSLITHLSVIPEMLPCTLQIPYQINSQDPENFLISHGNNVNRRLQSLPQSKSAVEEYQNRMRHFLNDSSIPDQEQYQQLSDFSSMVSSFDIN